MAPAATLSLLLVLTALVWSGAAAPTEPGQPGAEHAEHAEHADGADHDNEGSLRRVANFIKAYAIRHGAGMLSSDDDIKCIMQMGHALRNEKEINPLAAPVLNAMRVVMHTSPHCKLNVLVKGRMFLSPDFLKGLGHSLIGQDGS